MDTKTIRMRALQSVRQNWGLSIAAGMIAFFLAGMGTSFLPSLSVSIPLLTSLQEGKDVAMTTVGNTSVNLHLSPTSILSLVQFIIGGVIQIGYCSFLLKQLDCVEHSYKELFSRFDYFGTGFAQRFLRSLYTTLWSLLLIIPGIVASLSYAMTPFILADHPELTASQAIDRSKAMMDGHKADLFMLHLTFLGWDILAGLTLNIGYLWLNPYKSAADAVFYRQLLDQQSTFIPSETI